MLVLLHIGFFRIVAGQWGFEGNVWNLRGSMGAPIEEPLLRPDEPVFDWQTNRGKRKLKIPMQLVLTSKLQGGAGLTAGVRSNILGTLGMDIELRVRWLDDTDCLDYYKKHFKPAFASMMTNERRGSFRGDLCRAAVLYREGGFYVDLDLQQKIPATDLVDEETTFMSCFTADNAILNALIATTPRNPIMKETLKELFKWYSGEASNQAGWDEGTTTEWMGPLTMLRGLKAAMRKDCPDVKLENIQLNYNCGDQKLTLYREAELDCSVPNSECPPSRANSEFQGAHFGIFEMSGEERRLVAWPRFEACKDWGCDSGGWVESEM